MKSIIYLFTLICLSVHVGFAQVYLSNDKDEILDLNLNNGLPSDLHSSFLNFNTNHLLDNVEGLNDNSYVTTAAQLSSIVIEKEHIGRLVLHAKLFNKKDSILFNPRHSRIGDITVKPYRDNVLVNDISQTYHFEDDIYQQLYINTHKAGINKVIIDFESKDDLFILEHLTIVPLTDEGTNYYSEVEQSEQEILNLSKNLKNEASKLKQQYDEQINRIRLAHSSLNSIINGRTFENISAIQTNSLNPFKNDAFNVHFNELLKKASEDNRSDLQKLAQDLKDNDFSNVALSLDNLFLGGKFNSVINLIDGLFNKNINLKDKDNAKIDIITLDDVYYFKKNWGSTKFKLIPIEDKSVLNQINQLTAQNSAFKIYVNDIGTFLKDDLKTLNDLNTDIITAKTIRKDFEDLTWEFFKRFAQNERSHYIKDTGVNFYEIGTQLEKNFNPRQIKNISELKQIRKETILSIKKINELMVRYDAIISKIKTKYNLIYEIRPKQRKKHFNSVSHLPDNLKSDWKDKQDEIIDEYTKAEGLKAFLEKL